MGGRLVWVCLSVSDDNAIYDNDNNNDNDTNTDHTTNTTIY